MLSWELKEVIIHLPFQKCGTVGYLTFRVSFRRVSFKCELCFTNLIRITKRRRGTYESSLVGFTPARWWPRSKYWGKFGTRKCSVAIHVLHTGRKSYGANDACKRGLDLIDLNEWKPLCELLVFLVSSCSSVAKRAVFLSAYRLLCQILRRYFSFYKP